MGNIKRTTFLKISALTMLTPLANNFLLLAGTTNIEQGLFNNDFFKKLLVANDKEVEKLLATEADKSNFARRVGFDFAILSASYCAPDSSFYHSTRVVSKLEKLTKVLVTAQSEDGTVNIGNLESPPDTAFLLEPLSAGAYLLVKDKSNELSNINNDIKNFILKSGVALVEGGVHTPNHRWVICAALAHLNALYPNKKYVNRIEEWLTEGIYIDSDGHYPERSRTYDYVENNSLITISRLLNKPELLNAVRKNLSMCWYYIEPNGDMVTTDSRRQDQWIGRDKLGYYLHYRYMAIRDNDAAFAGIANFLETLPGFQEEVLNRSLFRCLENPVLLKNLPVATMPPVNYEKLFTTSSLLRIRRANTTTTFFGGVDWPLIIASGRSNSPNFYAYRKGKAILNYMRLSTDFFSMGYFYSDGIQKVGNKYILHKKLQVPYYQPLPGNLKNAKGDYKLSPSIDDRFWNKMDFGKRPVSNVKTLETTVSLIETNGKNEITFNITGQPGVAVTIELCFASGGKLSGPLPATDSNNFLETGMGQYKFGDDTITFGPGTVAHRTLKNLEGERYSTHFGSLRTEGIHVYLTGTTPFKHTLTFE
ncbi:MAG: hypothetical protein ABIN01_17155 [Ferruginibacter sp.]